MPDYWMPLWKPQRIEFGANTISQGHYIQQTSPQVPQPVIWKTGEGCTERYRTAAAGGGIEPPIIPET